MAKLKPYEYMVIKHPNDLESEEGLDSMVLVEKTFKMAKSEKVIGTLAARQIPEEHIEDIDQIEIIIRPF